MGKIFRYISDSFDHELIDRPCGVCGDIDSPRYLYVCELGDDAIWDEYGVCAPCINSGRVQKDAYEIDRISEVIVRNSGDLPSLIESFHKIPYVTRSIQVPDWPICCGDWCEFVGHPKDRDSLDGLTKEYQDWRGGPWGTEFNAEYELLPELLEDVCLFVCLNCEKKYHIHGGT